MVSIPDDLLSRIDADAKERGESRSAFLQEAARARLGVPNARVLAAMESIKGVIVGVRGPTAVEAVRRDRDRILIGRR